MNQCRALLVATIMLSLQGCALDPSSRPVAPSTERPTDVGSASPLIAGVSQAPGEAQALTARDRRPIAEGDADVAGLTTDQLATMFDEAFRQAGPSREKMAVCVAMQGLGDRREKDAPQAMIEGLADRSGLPTFPASKCAFDHVPYVIETDDEAILYSVKVESRDARGVLTFWATAAFGNLGAYSTQFRLVHENGRWTPEATGVSAVS